MQCNADQEIQGRYVDPETSRGCASGAGTRGQDEMEEGEEGEEEDKRRRRRG